MLVQAFGLPRGCDSRIAGGKKMGIEGMTGEQDRRVFQLSDPDGVFFDVVGWDDALKKFLDMIERTEMQGSFRIYCKSGPLKGMLMAEVDYQINPKGQ
jgi:hypothetical protein